MSLLINSIEGLESLFSTRAGLVTGEVAKIPSRKFIPGQLVQSVATAENLSIFGSKRGNFDGGTISFNYKNSLQGTIGEIAERYCNSLYDESTLVSKSYDELLCSGNNIVNIKHLQLYTEEQCREENLEIENIKSNQITEWVECFDILNKKNIFVPAFLVYLTHTKRNENNKKYIDRTTSTGLSAERNLDSAIAKGFLECVERHNFVSLWYNQNTITVPQYTKETILRNYKNNEHIQTLFKNHNVYLKVFDLSIIFPVETILVFLYFDYKGKLYQSCGSASRFTKEEAIIKATLEAYQGVDYALSLIDKQVLNETSTVNDVDDYGKHFAYYNFFPAHREQVPLLQQAIKYNEGDNEIYERSKNELCNSFLAEELKKLGLNYIIYKETTTVDIQQIGLYTVRVVVPELSLLTASNKTPFLGKFNSENLFTNFPHPFP